MKEFITFFVLAFSSIIVIINPVLVTSFYLSLVPNTPVEMQHTIIRRSTIASLIILFAFALFGTLIFRLFSISIGAFEIAGGVILFSVAWSMLHAKSSRIKETPEEIREAQASEDVSIVPLALPIISGPGAITAVIVLTGSAKDWEHYGALFAAIVTVIGITYVTMRNAVRVKGYLGTSGINILTRLMGLILAALAMQFVIGGIKSLLPELAKTLVR